MAYRGESGGDGGETGFGVRDEVFAPLEPLLRLRVLLLQHLELHLSLDAQLLCVVSMLGSSVETSDGNDTQHDTQ